MIKFRANQQFLAMRGERFARLPDNTSRSATVGAGVAKSPSPSTAGQEAAPDHPPPDGAASDMIICVDWSSQPDMTAIHALISPRVVMLFSLICAQQGLPPDEVISRGICLFAEKIGIAALARDLAHGDERRHGNSCGKSDHE